MQTIVQRGYAAVRAADGALIEGDDGGTAHDGTPHDGGGSGGSAGGGKGCKGSSRCKGGKGVGGANAKEGCDGSGGGGGGGRFMVPSALGVALIEGLAAADEV